ncbi:MAG: NAD(+)/NADH kinase [Pseudomonadales bacterium]
MGIIGIIANPASGKDVRRLVARASVFDNQEKQAIVGRALSGIRAAAGSDCRIAYFDDAHGIARGALELAGGGLEAEAVEGTGTVTALDTVHVAERLREIGCAVVITLGGDGTNRAVTTGWPDATLIPISTGTNNVFPTLVEATIAGAAAGLVAAGHVPLDEVSHISKLVRVDIDGEAADLALIDAVLSRERFVGSRALLSPDHLAAALLTRADPAAVGMTALGGLIDPLGIDEDAGLLLTLGGNGARVNAPIAPGFYREVGIESCRRVAFRKRVSFEGPGVLAFDGERERVLKPGQQVRLTIDRSGPRVVDVTRTLHAAAALGRFRTGKIPAGRRRSARPAGTKTKRTRT